MEGDGQVCRDGPGSRRPYENKNFFPPQRRKALAEIRDSRKLNGNRWGGMIFIFHFRLSQSGLAGGTPVNWFFPPVDRALADEAAEFAGDGCFIVIAHRQVRIFPFSHDSQAFKFPALDVYEIGSEFPAEFSFLDDGG